MDNLSKEKDYSPAQLAKEAQLSAAVGSSFEKICCQTCQQLRRRRQPLLSLSLCSNICQPYETSKADRQLRNGLKIGVPRCCCCCCLSKKNSRFYQSSDFRQQIFVSAKLFRAIEVEVSKAFSLDLSGSSLKSENSIHIRFSKSELEISGRRNNDQGFFAYQKMIFLPIAIFKLPVVFGPMLSMLSTVFYSHF